MHRSKPRSFKLRAGMVLGAAAFALSMFAGSAQAAAVAAKQTLGPIWIAMPTASAPLQSLTVTAPATGMMIVTVAGSVNYLHTNGIQGFYCVSLSKTSGDTGGCVPNAGSDSAMRNYVAAAVPTTVPGFGASEGYSIVRIWPVKIGVTYTFYLNGYETGMDAASLFQSTITALWVPGTLH